MKRRDGHEGWTPGYEAAWDRIFGGDPSSEYIAELSGYAPLATGDFRAAASLRWRPGDGPRQDPGTQVLT